MSVEIVVLGHRPIAVAHDMRPLAESVKNDSSIVQRRVTSTYEYGVGFIRKLISSF